MKQRELQKKIDYIFDQSFNPTRQQKIYSILAIVSSIGFENALKHLLETKFGCSDIDLLADEHLEEVFAVARTWRHLCDRVTDRKPKHTVVAFPGGRTD